MDDGKTVPFSEKMQILAGQIETRLTRYRQELAREMDAAEADSNNVVRMAQAFVHASQSLDRITAGFKQTSGAFKVVAERTMPEALAKSPLKNVPLEDLGYRVQTSTRITCSIHKGERERAFDYLRSDTRALSALEIGEYDLAVEYLRTGDRKPLAATLNKALKENKNPDELLEIAKEISNEVAETTLGLEHLITETVNGKTLSSTAKRLADDHGIELPDDIFNTYPQTTTSAVKLPKKPK